MVTNYLLNYSSRIYREDIIFSICVIPLSLENQRAIGRDPFCFHNAGMQAQDTLGIHSCFNDLAGREILLCSERHANTASRLYSLTEASSKTDLGWV